jgi:hypothetical protein
LVARLSVVDRLIDADVSDDVANLAPVARATIDLP